MSHLPTNLADSALRTISDIPSDLGERQREVLARKLSGMSNRAIGRALNVSGHTVADDIKRVFPDGRVPAVPELVEAFVQTSAMAIVSECLGTISPEDIAELPVKDKAALAGTCTRLARMLTATPPPDDDPEAAIHRLKSL